MYCISNCIRFQVVNKVIRRAGLNFREDYYKLIGKQLIYDLNKGLVIINKQREG